MEWVENTESAEKEEERSRWMQKGSCSRMVGGDLMKER